MTDTAKAREYRFTTWDDTTLIITVDEDDPGDMGEPRMLVDYDNGPTTYVSVRTTLDAERERYAALVEAARAMADAWVDYVEAQAGRGHIGQTHNSESVLEGGCGICAAAQYGTEVAITEHVLPALRAALRDDR